MRHLFPGHYRPSKESFGKLWGEGVVVPDTNVLLDLYRYPEATSLEVLGAFEKIASRLWIPHQIALEYQWNRDFVIFEQEGRYSKTITALDTLLQGVQREVSDKRHAFIDADSIVATLTRARDECVAKIKEAEKKQLGIGGDDHITTMLGRLFEGKIGAAPNAATLEKLYEEGERRFKRRHPPGFLDEKKKRKKSDLESDVHLHKGLEYKRKFGDWIAWSQLLESVSEKKIKHVIWITGETGEDWWHFVGHKRVGPRPELVEEIHDRGAEVFHMYDLTRFLEYARKNLSAAVSLESLERVQEINESRADAEESVKKSHSTHMAKSVLSAVRRWIHLRFPGTAFARIGNKFISKGSVGQEVVFRVFDCTRSYYFEDFKIFFSSDRERGNKFRRVYVFVFPTGKDGEDAFSRIRELMRKCAPVDSELHVGCISLQGEYVSVASVTPA